MSTNPVRGIGPGVARVDMKVEVIVIPVSDVDRAKEFYRRLGWRLDVTPPIVVQFTPHGSGCSVQFGKTLTSAAPGSAKGYLIVSDIALARKKLVDAGVEVSEVFHIGTEGRASGPDPEHRSYFSRATFSDPDGNSWVLQEITTRLPGRIDSGVTSFGSARFGVRRPPTSSTRGTAARQIRTGPTGTPNTWRRSRLGRSCRRERL
jgi:catechol 2,3-dioxygenase-like lactoylglutathione lyase family enzyme